MRWYVSRNGETLGPVDEAEIRKWAQEGMVVPGMFFRDEAGSAWTPVEQSPFAALMTGAAAPAAGGSEALGTLLVAIPLLATLLVWLWVGQMNLLQDPTGSLTMLSLVTVGLTALLMAVEASQLGMGRRAGKNGKQQSGPVAWFIAGCVLWLVAFPWYLSARGQYGRRGLGIAGVLMAVIFTFSVFSLGSAIESKKAQIRRSLDAFGSMP